MAEVANPFGCLTQEQEQHLLDAIEAWYGQKNESVPQALYDAGFDFPSERPDIWDKLPEAWGEMMAAKGITAVTDSELEDFLEKWLRLLGYAYWVEGIWTDRFNAITRAANYIKDYIFAHAQGGREQKAAVAGAHPIYLTALHEVNDAERKLTELRGLIRHWEKIEFTISRTITNRQGRMR